MGMPGPCSRSSYDRTPTQSRSPSVTKIVEKVVERPVFIEKKVPNPDPLNYLVKRYEYVGKFLIIDVVYPDCNNYEGRKFLVYEDVVIADLKKQVSIDPHFSSNKKFHSPVARFEPTVEGWERALLFAKVVDDKEEGIFNDGWRN